MILLNDEHKCQGFKEISTLPDEQRRIILKNEQKMILERTLLSSSIQGIEEWLIITLAKRVT